MKKTLLFAVSLLFLSNTLLSQSWGLWEADRSWIGLGDGEADNWYSLWDDGVGTFNGSNLGTFYVGDNYQVYNWDVKTWGNNAQGAAMWIRVYETLDPSPPGFQEWWTTNSEVIGGANRVWRGYVNEGTHGGDELQVNILNGLEPGNYTLELYIRAWGTDPGEHFDNNDGDNYSATFTVERHPSTFTGTGNWSEDERWSHGVPDSETDATINGNVSISAAANVRNLTVKSGASIVDNNVNGQLTIHGDFIMEREIDDGGFAWHFLSAPVSGMTIIGSDFVPDPNGGTLPSNFDFYYFDESKDLPWINIRGAGGTPNESFDADFVSGKGYLVAYDDEYGITTFQFTGTMQTGSINYELAYTAEKAWSGWNLLGNPYPSAIQWQDAYAGQFEQNSVYIYDPSHGGGGGYVDIEQGAFIPANQGFFALVDSEEGGNNFTFNNAMRAHGGEFMKNDTPAVDQLKLRLASNDYWDETTIRIRENSEFSRDRQDALKLFSLNAEVPQLYSKSSDLVQLSINSVPEITDETVFPVGMRIPAEGEYTLSLQELTGVFATESIYLTDLKLNKAMLFDANNPYTFTASPDDDPIRFKLHFSTMDDPTNIEDVDAPSVKLWYSNNTLYVNSHEHNTTVEVYDISGRRLQSHTMAAGEHRIELNLPAGAYIVQSSGNSHHETMKIIIQ